MFIDTLIQTLVLGILFFAIAYYIVLKLAGKKDAQKFASWVGKGVWKGFTNLSSAIGRFIGRLAQGNPIAVGVVALIITLFVLTALNI